MELGYLLHAIAFFIQCHLLSKRMWNGILQEVKCKTQIKKLLLEQSGMLCGDCLHIFRCDKQKSLVKSLLNFGRSL